MSATRPCCQNGVAWLAHTYGRGYLAALTGQDSSALAASLHVLELLARGDAPGRDSAVVALRALVAAMQPHTREHVRELIKFMFDERFQAYLWPVISVSERDAIQSARALIKLALDEEQDTIERQKIGEIDARLEALPMAGELLPHLRTLVRELSRFGLPGGEFELAAKAWLVRRENGGTACARPR